MNFPVTIRPLVLTAETERNFVLQSWVRAGRQSQWATLMGSATYYRGQQSVVERLVTTATVRVAEVEGRPGELAGWACGEHHKTQGLVLHFVYVKQVYRRLGVARALIGAAEYREASHWTHIASHVPMLKGLNYNPYLQFN